MAKEFTLSDRNTIPSIAFGTFGIDDRTDKEKVIENALLNGYRHLDLAYIYKNENYVGDAIKNVISKSDGMLKREELFITSKLHPSYFSPSAAFEMIDQQLAACQLDYFDLYLMHAPLALEESQSDVLLEAEFLPKPGKTDITDTWTAMEKIKAEGKAKSIGVSNFDEINLKRILDTCEEPPVVNQVEVNPYVPCYELQNYCRKHNILLAAYGGLGGRHRSWGKPTDPRLLKDPVIVDIAARLKITPAQVLIRWLLQRDILVVTKSTKLDRLKDIMKVYDIILPDDVMAEISSINRRFRYYMIPWMLNHPEYQLTY